MEPVTLGATVMSILMPYVVKKAERFIEIAGRSAYNQAKKLLATLKARWAGDKEATDQLALFERNPDRYWQTVEDTLVKRLDKDGNLAAELKQVIEQMGPSLTVIQEMDEAKKVTGLRVRHMKKGRASITQKAKKAENMTGADIDTLGD